MSKKILSIDDSKMVHMVIARTLKPYDIEVITALNGQEGLDKAHQEHPDLIVLDMTMPVMDGYEAAKTIRKLADILKSKTPIVAMTASVIKSEVDKCYESGMDDFISKPFEPEDLRQKILKYATTKNTLN